MLSFRFLFQDTIRKEKPYNICTFASHLMMEPAIVNNDSKSTIMARMCCWPQDMSKSLIANVVTLLGMTKKLAKDDPRRVIYSLKVGLALTLVSLFYYFQPLYNTFDDSATWAIITVVVVFEYTVGKS